MARGTWQATVHGMEKSWTRLSEYFHFSTAYSASQAALEVKNPPASEGDARDVGSIPGSGR